MKAVRIFGSRYAHPAKARRAEAIQPTMDRTRLQQLSLRRGRTSRRTCSYRSPAVRQTAPAFSLNPKNGVEYTLAIQTPQYQVGSIDELLRTPMYRVRRRPAQLLGISCACSRIRGRRRHALQHAARHRSVRECRGARPRQRRAADREARRHTARRCRAAARSPCAARCRPCALRTSAWASAVAMAIVLVYLLIVVNFQSWIDPLIIVSAAGGARGHRVDAVPHRHDSERARADGRNHGMGVATANSILMVSFAAAASAARRRSRPRSKRARAGSGRC